MASQRPTLSDIEARALVVERKITSQSSSDAQLDAAIKSAELYMQALRISTSTSERKRLDRKCKEVLAKAESIKALKKAIPSNASPNHADDTSSEAPQGPQSTRTLTTREKIILLEGSKVNGFLFKQWDKDPLDSEFELKDGEPMFLDSPTLPLPESHMSVFTGWKRPAEILQTINETRGGELRFEEPTMEFLSRIDLVQDMTSDCSVVASMCSGFTRAERGHPKVSFGICQKAKLTINRTLPLFSGLVIMLETSLPCLQMASIFFAFTSMAAGEESR